MNRNTAGRYDLQGSDLFAIVSRYSPVAPDEKEWESHYEYGDIQVLLLFLSWFLLPLLPLLPTALSRRFSKAGSSSTYLTLLTLPPSSSTNLEIYICIHRHCSIVPTIFLVQKVEDLFPFFGQPTCINRVLHQSSCSSLTTIPALRLSKSRLLMSSKSLLNFESKAAAAA